MIDELINKRWTIQFAYQKGGKIANAFYKDKADAHGGVDMDPTGKKLKR